MATLLFSTGHAAEAAILSPAAPTPTTLKAQPVTERPDRVSAALSARLQKSRVLVAAETTETTLTYANPDGTITLEASSGPVRVKQGDAWTAIDTNLVAKDGVLKPKAALANVTFSGGGEGKRLAVLERSDKQSYALTWPAPLPVPKVEANRATYFDAAGPGGDLVVTALPTGFRYDVVLRERPTGPVEYKIKIKTEGLKLAETDQGGLQLTDTKGKTVASASEPVMYDTPTSLPAQESAAPTGKAKPTAKLGAIDTEVIADGDQQTLVLKPDPKFLADPDTTYPVTVDPTTTLPLLADMTVFSQGGFSQSLTVGNSDSDTARTFTRGLLKFDTSALTSQVVTDRGLSCKAGVVGDA
ncbi:hypothetical protein [Nonomuraea aurantiaca]|uniref:hypothetical protein n=1 Tax=Nonomuraea aurantiaca TaxID=2878562 RepID=UPI001CD95F93|nr:hypothetical protein [Nonomuraea aurantiaca]MCA2223094.1 hypothetical protein [Nonomuraea aurantiaca]